MEANNSFPKTTYFRTLRDGFLAHLVPLTPLRINQALSVLYCILLYHSLSMICQLFIHAANNKYGMSTFLSVLLKHLFVEQMR